MNFLKKTFEEIKEKIIDLRNEIESTDNVEIKDDLARDVTDFLDYYFENF